jgi:hypothetical protein
VETSLISADSKTFEAQEVAADLVNGMQYGAFTIATGFDGLLLEKGTCTMAPLNLLFPLEVGQHPTTKVLPHQH